MAECACCDSPSGVLYDWHCPGCRARMLAALPSKESRAGWLKRWRDQGEGAMVDKVLQKLREIANARG